jgi:hypothetical protein
MSAIESTLHAADEQSTKRPSPIPANRISKRVAVASSAAVRFGGPPSGSYQVVPDRVLNQCGAALGVE